jgi:signal transduction histidine kinase
LAFIYLSILIWRIVVWGRSSRKNRRANPVLVTLLIVLVPFFSLFFVIRLALPDLANSFPASEQQTFLVPFLAVLPWMLAGGLLPPVYAVVGAILSGILTAGFIRHSWLLPLELGLAALLYSEFLRQSAQYSWMKFFRHPLVAGLISANLGIALEMLAVSIGEPGAGLFIGQDARLVLGKYFSLLLPFVMGGIGAATISHLFEFSWVKPEARTKSNGEAILLRNHLRRFTPLYLGLVFAMLGSTWIISTAAARTTIEVGLMNIAGNISRNYYSPSEDWLSSMPAAQISSASDFQNVYLGDGVQVYLLDDTGQVVYSQDASRTGSTLDAAKPALPELVIEQPLGDSGWRVRVSEPLARVQTDAWKTAFPISIVILGFTILLYAFLKSGLTSMARSIKSMTAEVERMARGGLEQSQTVRGEDEIGQLGNTLEGMRHSLKSNLDQHALLIQVSQGINASLDLPAALRPILEAALTNGGGMARVTLLPDSEQDSGFEKIQHFSLGEMERYYAYLEEEVLAITRSREYVTLNNLQRSRGLRLDPQKINPSALISLSIKQGNRLLGILWVAYETPRTFTEAEIKFLSILATDCALAVNNIRLYQSAELGKKRLLAIIGSTPDPILLLDQLGRIALANNPARSLASLYELIPEGRQLTEVFTNPDLQELYNQGNGSREIHFYSGKTFHVSIASLWVDGVDLGKVCLMRDVTDYKEVDSRRSEFVANVSHDLRSPLVLMRGNSMMIQNMGQLNEQQKTYLARIQSGIDGMLRLVNNLLDLERIESGIDFNMKPISLSELLRRVRDDLELQRENKSIQWVEEGSTAKIYVSGDETLLYQAFYNLFENAIKFSNLGSAVRVSCNTESDGEVIVAVQDQGKGIAPIDLPRIFESAYRSQNREGFTQRQLAMGLHIVKKITDRHHGRVWVSSQLGQGSTFFIALPVTAQE